MCYKYCTLLCYDHELGSSSAVFACQCGIVLAGPNNLRRALPTGPSNAWGVGGVWVETTHKAVSDDSVVSEVVLQQLTDLWYITAAYY